MSARLPGKYRYIVVEGPIGAGKTSLARLLSEHAGGRGLFEEPQANPFLPGFYQDRARYALPAQLYFLFHRANQARMLTQPDLFAHLTVADFLLEKDALFARLNLTDDEFALYEQVYARVRTQAPAPDLVIYLQASPETLIERVRRRAAAYERGIAEDYLVRLAQAYTRFFYGYEAAPLLIVNSDHLDFIDQPGDFDLLLQRICALRGPREFFSFGT
ncbi:MAG: deoxynucleoside kinase [Burkholderiales bacterium]|nr:deoxynucleoside kinase [Burkholderiales bacterium]